MDNPYNGSGFGPMMERGYIEIGTEMFEGECYTTITCTNPNFKKKKKHLTQADIDRLDPASEPVHPALGWLLAVPGLILTILVLAAAVGGFWGLMLLWEMK